MSDKSVALVFMLAKELGWSGYIPGIVGSTVPDADIEAAWCFIQTTFRPRVCRVMVVGAGMV